jgi:hypothetical protein
MKKQLHNKSLLRSVFAGFLLLVYTDARALMFYSQTLRLPI